MFFLGSSNLLQGIHWIILVEQFTEIWSCKHTKRMKIYINIRMANCGEIGKYSIGWWISGEILSWVDVLAFTTGTVQPPYDRAHFAFASPWCTLAPACIRAAVFGNCSMVCMWGESNRWRFDRCLILRFVSKPFLFDCLFVAVRLNVYLTCIVIK